MAESTNPPKSTMTPQPPQQVYLTAEQMMEMIRQMKEPSDEEKERKALELERKKDHAKQSVQMAEQYLANRLSLQQRCSHNNGKYHTFVGNNHGDGNSVAICQICGIDFKWRTSTDQMRQGLNLIEMPYLTKEHLLAWERQYPYQGGDPPDRQKLLTRAGKKAAA